ncbi:MAG: family 1 glycosylhydrolase [Acholeplasmatales bacterium]|nr:family 1 glycosylhydrolase [Acholeplasmatales bacterium]
MFNKDFIFGCSTASYQIEGYIDSDGKCESIWDTFTKIPGKIDDGSDGSVVCGSYKRYKEDIKALKELNVDSYRFSIAWSRVITENNKPNIKGLEYYKKLSQELAKANIKPLVTLYHWDMPQWLEDKGGFLNDEISDYFAYYTDVVTKYLDGLVSDYITINEPQCIMQLGHRVGAHAPGTIYTDKEMLQAIHNLLKCHGKAVKVIRNNIKNSTVSIAPCSRPMVPKDRENELLEEKCYEKYFELKRDYEYPNTVSIYMDPVFLGDYPKEYYEIFSDVLPNITKEDLDLISQPVDFIYQNFYSGNYYSLDENNNLVKEDFYKGYPEGNIGWLQVVPEALYYGPKYLYERYKKPIIISENGFCNNDVISLDGKVHDPERIDYIERYLMELEKVSKIIDVKGYYVWSLLDNFEWNNGLRKRFGLIYIDYQNNCRIKKDSFYFYKKIIKNKKIFS